MDRHNPQLIVDSSLAGGSLVEGRETVSQMVARYDQAINTWGETWGNRNHVVAAINGSFFDLKTGVPWSGLVQSGWYAKWYGSLAGSSGLVWTLERNVFIGRCVYHRPDRQVVTFSGMGESLEIDGVNTDRDKNDLVLYTPQFADNTGTNNKGIEVLVEMTRPASILPLPAKAFGRIREVRDRQGSAEIPFDYVVLSATGEKAEALRRLARPGWAVGVSMEVTDLGDDCATPTPGDWTKAYAGIGGSFLFLDDGDVVDIDEPGAVVRNPRTAICFNEDWIFFVVVDGRAEGYSVGMTMNELGRFCKRRLEANWGINQDGGGSSTMWIDGEVVNRPSDGWERPVANGMMIIQVEPKATSSSYRQGQQVLIVQDASVLLGPGPQYASRASVRPMTVGVVQAEVNDLNGVLAKGSNWWFLRFGLTSGWVPETALQAYDGRPLPGPETWPPAG